MSLPQSGTVHRFRTYAGACAAYAAIALLYNWPLPRELGSAVTGPIGGDTGVYVWNLWLFSHEMFAHHHFPLFTHEILSLSPRVDLSLHNYTIFANLMAIPLLPRLGVTTTFNVVYLGIVTLTALAMFALARAVVGRTAEAWLAGLLFGFSPWLVARSTGHFSLVAAAPLPVFVLCLLRADRQRSARYAAACGLTIAWATTCDAYYGIFCLLIGAVYLAARHVAIVRRRARNRTGRARTVLNGAIACVAVVVGAIVVTGGTTIRIGPVSLKLYSLYTPVLALTVLVAAQAIRAYRMRVCLPREALVREVRLVTIAGVCATVPLLPVLYAFAYRLHAGGMVHGPIYWRSSPEGVDLLSLVMPNANHALFGGPWRSWLATRAGGFIENVASLTLTGIGVVAIAVRRYRFRPPRVWLALTLFFAALAVGPFVHVGGVNTFIPGPWALLRYMPIVGATRTPARYAIVLMMAFSVLFALALQRITSRHAGARPAILVVAGLVLGFELAPFPRATYSAEIPSVYRTVAADPREVRVLEIPFGIRDGEWSEGDFTAASQFYQTIHQKPIIGGYLSRVTRGDLARVEDIAFLDRLMRLSEGRKIEPVPLQEMQHRGRRFIARSDLGYVVMDTARTSARLRKFAVDALGLERIAVDDGHELYAPAVSRLHARQ